MPQHTISNWIFLACFGTVLYVYVGYWLVLRLFARRLPVRVSAVEPSISIVIAARNEAQRLPVKLQNLTELEYPAHLVQIIVVSDGSTDNTAEVLTRFPGVEAVLLDKGGGKSLALNEGVRRATGELLFMLDVRQRVDRDALRQLVPLFADAVVGAVSGELLLEGEDGTPSGDGVGLYWRIEKAVRHMESESGSVVGVTGAIYLMRRALYRPLPAGLILDDVLIPMEVVRQGHRVLFQPAAVARDTVFTGAREFRRKIRTLTGNFQIVQQARWLLSSSNPLLFRYVSHKLLRLLVPFLLVIMLVASAVSGDRFMHLLLGLQLLFFSLALVGEIWPKSRSWRLIGVPATFTMLNCAAAVAWYKFLTRQSVWHEENIAAQQ